MGEYSTTNLKQAVRLRYPERLVNEIDREISRSGLYLSRSDYVASHIRSYLDYVMVLCSAAGHEPPRPNSVAIGKLNLTKRINNSLERFAKYGGKTIDITVILPQTLCERLKEVGRVTGIYKGLQTPIKCAVLSEMNIISDRRILDWNKFEKHRKEISECYASGVDYSALQSEMITNMRETISALSVPTQGRITHGIKALGTFMAENPCNPYSMLPTKRIRVISTPITKNE